ncbi:aminoacyl-tRNA deacylase [Pseudomonas sp. TCU-HL1]|uniref:aminoacyl-tRNA deacylase n=1 Tax=Pseudomonas sp. TCU-HL1 TaxID=1856685 RepID=UPI00083D6A87|nr:YbaK/EbsC family protein [Pseudomonas sp. TCU-HL1]AOE87629.1 hypothetical protein THL1_5081 [Pseudomonas sp. TCU-HL1]
MTMITQLQNSLMQHQTRFDVLNHAASMTTREAARRAGVPPQQMAKPVILDDFQGHWLMAVVPASRHVDLEKVRRLTHRHWRLVHERDFGQRFANCDVGAIPAVGNLFGLDTLVDQSLTEQPDIYFESGRHDELVHMSGTQYMALMPDAKKGKFCE